MTKKQLIGIKLSTSVLAYGRKFCLSILLSITAVCVQAANGAQPQGFEVVSESSNELRLRLGDDYHFASGEASLSEPVDITSLVEYINSEAFVALRIEGHTDGAPYSNVSVGFLSSNWALSSARAAEIAQLLVASGVDAERILAIGMGSNHPISDNRSAAGRKANRRVELVLERVSSSDRVSEAVAEIDENASVSDDVLDGLRQARPDLQFTSVQSTAVPGLYEVEIAQGGQLYITESGEYFVVGEIYHIAANGIVNLTEQKRSTARAEMLSNVERKDLITFAAEGDQKAEIYVFTDVDCGYCRKLHEEVAELNAYGVTVNYLAYPRQGLGSDVYNRMVSAWCSNDPVEAMAKLKSGSRIPSITCEESPVANQFALGHKLGVTATPAILLADGTLSLGYRKASDLAAMAGVK